MLRTHYIHGIGEDQIGAVVTLAGWVEDIRNLGGIAFILLRDKTGRAQLTCIKKDEPKIFEKITELPRESVISAVGLCQKNEKPAYPKGRAGRGTTFIDL